MKKQTNAKLEELKEVYPDATISYWIMDFGIKCHIFTFQVATADQLKSTWTSFTKDIALYFQSSLEDEFECWNFYIVFLSSSSIPIKIKYEIENDKFSSRKIVVDDIKGSINETDIDRLIGNRIFNLEIKPTPSTNLKKEVSQLLDAKLYKYISGKELDDGTRDKAARKDALLKLVDEYTHEI